jgi:hypothetical protein
MTFATFLETAWTDHGDRPQEIADRMAASLAVIDAPDQIRPFAHLVTHVFGEHLGQWDRGIALLESLRAMPAFDGDPATAAALSRNIATLCYAGGNESALAALTSDDRVAVLAAAAAAFAGRGEFKRAIESYAEGLALAAHGLPADSPANRALAIGGNNLAAALEEKDDRDAQESAGMVAAAKGALQYWKVAGTWLEEERAEFRLTRSLLKAGDATAALQSATRCIEVCARNEAPAIESFYGYVVLALAQRAAGDANGFASTRQAALALHEQVPAEERKWCLSEIAELG